MAGYLLKRLDEMGTLAYIKKSHPARIEMNSQGLSVCYMRFGQYESAVGLGIELAEWQWRKMYRNALDIVSGVVWC